MPKEKLSDAQVALYSEKYLKMRRNSVARLSRHLTTEEGNRQYDLRNSTILRKWSYQVQRESGLLYFVGMVEIELNCLRYLAMREEACWHMPREKQTTDKGFILTRLTLDSVDNVRKTREQFDWLSENPKFHHGR